MKKNLFALGLVALFGFGLSSCNKCFNCANCDEGVTFINSNGTETTEVEVCEKDAANDTDFDAALADYESFGCTCSEI